MLITFEKLCLTTFLKNLLKRITTLSFNFSISLPNFKRPKKKGGIYPDNSEICPLVCMDPKSSVTNEQNF